MIPAVIAGLVAGYGIAIPVGAVGVYLVALAARSPWRTGAAAALGVATVDGAYAALAVGGASALVRVIEPIADPLRWASVGVLVLLAAHIAGTAVRRRNAAPEQPAQLAPARAYAGLVAMTMINPTTLVYFTAIVLGGQAAVVDSTTERLAFVLAATAASASWQLALSLTGGLLGRTLTGRRAQLTTAFASSAIIVLLALRAGPH